jgi:putative flippase GtrA
MLATLQRFSARAARWRGRNMALKAMSFALIGLVNTVIDASVFFTSYALIGASAAAEDALSQAAAACGCADTATLRLVVCNVAAWLVAVSCSYVMNSFITFAAESGRQLRWRDYATFAASGVVGAVANTVVLVLAAQALPVWAAKGLAILTSFVVNFSLSHFLVFRPKPRNTL